MDIKEKLSLLEDLFEMDEDSLEAAQVLDDLEEWDSMTKLSLIILMDEECGKKLTGDDIKQFATVQDILDFMG